MSHFRFSAFTIGFLLATGCAGTAVSDIVGQDNNGSATGSGGAASAGAGGAGRIGSGGAVNPNLGPLERSCVDSCAAQRKCGTSVGDACETDCVEGGNLFDDHCRTLVADEANCLAGLSCPELSAYINARSGNPTCGAAFDAFATACTENSGAIPSECQSYCEKATACHASRLDTQGCAESCLLALTGMNLKWGAQCADVQRRAYGCFGQRSCSEESLLAKGTVPPSCASLETEWSKVCK